MANTFVVLLILTIALKTRKCEGVRLPNYIPALLDYSSGRDDLIESYFHLDFEYTEILLYLGLFHGIKVSLRHLKRIS